MTKILKTVLSLIISLTSMSSLAAYTGDEAEAMLRHLYSNYKNDMVITTTERGEIKKKGELFCAYESIQTRNVTDINGDTFSFTRTLQENFNEECKLKTLFEEKIVIEISEEAKEMLGFQTYLKEEHNVDMTIDTTKMIITFEGDGNKAEIYYEGLTPDEFEATLTTGSSGQSGHLSYSAGGADVTIK